MTLSYKRDYCITEDSVGIIPFSLRKTYKIWNYPYANQFFCSPWKSEVSRFMKHEMVIIISILLYFKNFQDKKIGEASTIIGVDLDLNLVVVASTTDKKFKFFAGGELKNKKDVYKNMRVRLQSKGTYVS